MSDCGNSARYELSNDEYRALNALTLQVLGIDLGMVRVIPSKTDSLTVALLNRPYPHLDALCSWLEQAGPESNIPFQEERISLTRYEHAYHTISMGYGKKSEVVAYRFEAGPSEVKRC